MHKDLHRKVSYQYLIRVEAYKLIKLYKGEIYMWYTKSVEEVARELRTNTKFRVKGK